MKVFFSKFILLIFLIIYTPYRPYIMQKQISQLLEVQGKQFCLLLFYAHMLDCFILSLVICFIWLFYLIPIALVICLYISHKIKIILLGGLGARNILIMTQLYDFAQILFMCVWDLRMGILVYIIYTKLLRHCDFFIPIFCCIYKEVYTSSRFLQSSTIPSKLNRASLQFLYASALEESKLNKLSLFEFVITCAFHLFEQIRACYNKIWCSCHVWVGSILWETRESSTSFPLHTSRHFSTCRYNGQVLQYMLIGKTTSPVHTRRQLYITVRDRQKTFCRADCVSTARLTSVTNLSLNA